MNLRRLRWVMFLILCGWSLLSLLNVIYDTPGEKGGVDFHPYWFYGQYVHQGIEPYTAYIDKPDLDFDLTFIVGERTTLQKHSDSYKPLARTPANTAPMLLLLAPLSFVAWEIARFIWLGVNLIGALLIPWLVSRYIETAGFKLERPYGAFLSLVFWGMLATRVSLGTGQTATVVLVLMLSALLLRHDRHDAAAGIVFGVALSKYSMALPLLILFFLWREYRIIAYAVIVQVAGLVLLALTSSTSPISIIQAYIGIAFKHINKPGIHLAAYLPDSTAINLFIILLGFGLMYMVYVFMMQRKRFMKNDTQPLLPVFQISIFFIITLLMNYHGQYDLIVTLLPIGLIFLAATQANLFLLDQRQVRLLWALLIAIIGVQSLPGSAFSVILPHDMMETWLDLLALLGTVSLLVLLLVNLWLFNRLSMESGPEHFRISRPSSFPG